MLHHPETGEAAGLRVATAAVPGARPRPGQIALAAMAKVPIAGAVKTRLSPPLTPEQAAELARCFLVDRVEQLGELAASDRLVAFTPREREPDLRGLVPPGVRLVPQVGADLGARMDRLLSDLLAEGYAGAIAVGTDTPTLPTAYLGQACEALRGGVADMVLGPSRDGGYYLIGLSAPAPELFVNMPWSTAERLRGNAPARSDQRAAALGLAELGRRRPRRGPRGTASRAGARRISPVPDAGVPRRAGALMGRSATKCPGAAGVPGPDRLPRRAPAPPPPSSTER